MFFKEKFLAGYTSYMTGMDYVYSPQYNMYIKIVNGELVQYLTYIELQSVINEPKAFTVIAGIVSLYSENLEMDFLKKYCLDMYAFCKLYGNETHTKLYYTYDDNNVVDIINESLEHTKRNIMPVFLEIHDLNTYIDYCKRSRLDLLRGIESFNRDSLVLIKSENHDDFKQEFRNSVNQMIQLVDECKAGGTYMEHYQNYYYAYFKTIVEPRDKVYKDSKLWSMAQEEIIKRRIANMNTLRDICVIV